MKKTLLIVATLIMVAFTSCNKPADVMNYSDSSNWLKFENNPTKEIDLFYILPTIIVEGNDTVVYFADVDKARALKCYEVQASALEPFTNVYAPFYRQVPLNIAFTVTGNSENYAGVVRRNLGKKDIFAALDYYFENVNNGRPYFLASHSQGTAMTRAVLEEYMKNHPEYLSRMIADYALGYALPKGWFEANPHLTPATDEIGTGVVIGWNTEGPDATMPSMLLSGDDYVINPLNWRTDTTYVSVEENHGSIDGGMNTEAMLVTPGLADAQIDPERGVLVCTTIDSYIGQGPFGDKSLHGIDWGAYYINIRENAIKRAEAYLGHPIEE